MARVQLTEERGAWPVRNPWLLVLAGLGLEFVTLFLPEAAGTALTVARVALTIVALLAAGVAVWLRLHRAGQGADERAQSAALVALAALVPLLAYAGSPRAWDSIRLFLAVLTGVTLSGAVLVLLPNAARRAAVSLLILLHFGGIVTAVTDIATTGGEPPWLANVLWCRFYRFYLQFMYLNNAYHFYSPEPGPPTLLWFHIDYADGSERWVRLPEREQFHTRQEFQRRLALTESTNTKVPLPPSPDMIYRRRLAGGANPAMLMMQGVPFPGVVANPVFIPVQEEYPPQAQWQHPAPFSSFVSAAYARHVAHAYPSEKDPEAPVTGVKVYRVIHTMLFPPQMAARSNPLTPTLYMPYYQGEFDSEGNLKDPNDPFLYWHIPIMWYPENRLPAGFPKGEDEHVVVGEPREDPTLGKLLLIDFTKIHVTRKTPKPSP
jgi:hypothetical protein